MSSVEIALPGDRDFFDPAESNIGPRDADGSRVRTAGRVLEGLRCRGAGDDQLIRAARLAAVDGDACQQCRRVGVCVVDLVAAGFGVDREVDLVREMDRLEGVDRHLAPRGAEQVARLVINRVVGVQQRARQTAVDHQGGGRHVVDDRLEELKIDPLRAAGPTMVLVPEPAVAPTVRTSLACVSPPVCRRFKVSKPPKPAVSYSSGQG